MKTLYRPNPILSTETVTCVVAAFIPIYRYSLRN